MPSHPSAAAVAADRAPTSDRAALRTVRAVLRERSGQPSSSDLAYGLYLAIMLTIIVVAPFVRAVVLLLAGSPSPSPAAVEPLFAALPLLLAAAALAGAHTGPAHARLPEVDLILSSTLPRPLVLRRAMLRVALAAVLITTSVTGVLLGGAAARGDLALPMGLLPLAGAAGVGLLASVAMLLGQLGRACRWAVAVGSAALAGVWGTRAFGLLPVEWSASAAQLNWWVLGFGLVAAAVAAALSALVPWDVLREQSLRWSAVSALALTGDLHMATERLGAPVRVGRGWHSAVQAWSARAPGPTALILRRDLLGIMRTPGRSLGALFGAVASGALLAVGVLRADTPLWAAAAGATALLLAYASIGPWCRGLRAAAGTFGGLPIVPLAPSGLVLRHALLPLGCAGVTVSLSCLGTMALLRVDIASLGTAAVCGAGAGAVVLGLRLVGALKGPLPNRLLAPVPTPAGDMSGVNVLLWSLDGVFWAVLLGSALGAALAVAPPVAAAGAVLALVLLGIGAAVRLRSLSGLLRGI